MRAKWMRQSFLIGVVLSVGCNRADPRTQASLPVASAATIEASASKSVVVPVHHEGTADPSQVRLHLTLLCLEMQVPTEGLRPFSTELPDVFGTGEVCRVIATEELDAVIMALQQKGIARICNKQVIDAAEATAAIWETDYFNFAGATITPTIEADGGIHVDFVPTTPQSNAMVAVRHPVPATKMILRKNETLVVSAPAKFSGTVQVSRVPVLGDLPVIGETFFTSMGKPRFHNMKWMYLVSCEAISQ